MVLKHDISSGAMAQPSQLEDHNSAGLALCSHVTLPSYGANVCTRLLCSAAAIGQKQMLETGSFTNAQCFREGEARTMCVTA